MGDLQKQPRSIRHFEAGEKIMGFFVIRKKELKTKRDGTPYILWEFGDHSGRISATLWDNPKAVYEVIQVGDIVKAAGSVLLYNEALQITIEKIRKAEPSDGVEAVDFLRTEDIDIEALFQQLTEAVASIKNAHLRNLLEIIFVDPAQKNRLKEAPGGKLWHHAYLGGLLEHTVSVMRICEAAAALYPQVDGDLLLTGAMLHDIGKMEEYEFERGFIDYTDEGRLWGHIVIGAQKVRSAIEKLEKEIGFPMELKKRVVHMMLSHQGKLEQGSPVLPMTPEAMILYYADELDSKFNALKHIVERDEEPGKKWSKYINLLERFIYLGEHQT